MNVLIKIFMVIAFAAQVVLAGPAIRIGNIKVLPSPIESLEANGEGNVTFNLFESNGEVVPATVSGDVNTEITVDLKKCKLKDEDTANIFGALLTYFNVTVANGGKTLTFEQKIDIPGDTYEPMRILVEVTENAVEPIADKVGALVNIAATTGSSGDGSSYVFTKAAPTINAENDTFTVDPGMSTTTVFVNDDADGTSPATNALLTNPTISNNDGLTGLTIDANGILSVPVGTQAGTYTITYGICLEAYPTICDEANVIVIVDASPDYTPKIRLTGATTSGSNTIVPAILTVTEINAGINTGDIIIRVPKHDYISFVYNSSMTSLVGKAVNNSHWEPIDHPAEYRFKYIGNSSTFTANTFSRIGLQIIVNPESGASGKIDFKIDIKPGTGDKNAVNDSDSSQIDYTN